MKQIFAAWAVIGALTFTAASARAAAQGYQPPPRVTVSDPRPAAGALVDVVASGCHAPAGAAGVPIVIDGVAVGRGTPDEAGAFTISVRVPDEANGTVTVAAGCASGSASTLIDVRSPDLPFEPGDDDPSTEEGSGAGTGGRLPLTGGDPRAVVRVAILCTAAGSVLLAGSRRRRHGGAVA